MATTGTKYRTIKTIRYALQWRVRDCDPDNGWKPTEIHLVLKRKEPIRNYRNKYYDINDVHRTTPYLQWAPNRIRLEDQKDYYILEIWNTIWFETFTDLEKATIIYNKFLNKDFDDLIMMGIL